MGSENGSVEARLDRLERSNRRLRAGLLASVAAVGALAFLAADAPVGNGRFNTLTANRLDIVDGRGRTRVALDATPLPVLQFLDGAGRDRVLLAQWRNFAELLFFGRKNMTKWKSIHVPVIRMELATAGLRFEDSDGTPAIAIGGDGETPASIYRGLSIYGLAGSKASLSLSGSSPALRLSDAAGYSTVIGSTGLLNHLTGETRQTSAASIVMFGNGKQHRVIWQAPSR